MNTEGTSRQWHPHTGLAEGASSVIKKSNELIAKSCCLKQDRLLLMEQIRRIQTRMAILEREVNAYNQPVNSCIDFVLFNKPPTKANWAVLYFYTTSLRNGYYLSAS